MIFPKPLKRGGCVGLVAPSSPITPKQRILCKKQLKDMGYTVVLGQSLEQDDNVYGYLAGDGRARAADINELFADRGVDAIFCVRGGYGGIQTLPYLDYKTIKKNPKIFMGYSDVTSIHMALMGRCGLVTFHGPMAKPNFLPEPENFTIESMEKAWNGKAGMIFENPPNQEFTVLAEGCAQGRLIGGNLTVLASMMGTPFVPRVQDAILFLEDVGEKIPRLHRALTQLEFGGIFQGIKGVLLGDFTQCSNAGYDERLEAETFFRNWLAPLDIPVMGNVYSDHRAPMGTLPLGAWCRMDTEKSAITFWGQRQTFSKTEVQ